MTLTALRYLVAVAGTRHFGKAAKGCHVSQPALSTAVRKLEEELGIPLFERGSTEATVTPIGLEIVQQARVILDQVARLRDIARQGLDPLDGPLTLGVIYTIGPYLLPDLVRQALRRTPTMPLVLQERFTADLLDLLREGSIDCAILAEPFADAGLAVAALYDEPFVAVVPAGHPLARQPHVTSEQLQRENMLLLGRGHCFRDHVLQACPETAPSYHPGLRGRFEGSSLDTLQHMVAAGIGVTLVPRLGVPPGALEPGWNDNPHVRYLPFGEAPPTRRVVLCWRHSFPRHAAIAALRNAIHACALPGVARL
ncbi:LysR substrate-binding domain-containing protein [Candidatus Symbiobacter mobilis]|uniref:LysR substrate-binding domain-containing protein n=1 Tax=Candidatus Symbiobacter mobilis TaxID=1436290 RepID=UPI00059BECC2|nr:LysR substrate-binding domain-containing protein [Candidatus Symbiobacter mobilis]